MLEEQSGEGQPGVNYLPKNDNLCQGDVGHLQDKSVIFFFDRSSENMLSLDFKVLFPFLTFHVEKKMKPILNCAITN